MKKNTASWKAVLRGLSAAAFILISIMLSGSTGHAQTATDGDYRSRVTTGNWSAGSSWEVRAGGTWSTASTAPTSSNNVYIQPGHAITVDVAVASCRDFHIATATAGTSAAIGANFLDVYGKMRWFTNASGAITGSTDGAFYSGNTSSSSGGANSAATSGSGALRIRGTKRTVFASTDWGASGFATTTLIFNMSSSTDTAFISSAVKMSSISITNSSTVSAGSSTRFSLNSDNGNFTIESGSTLVAARGGTGNILFSGASNTTTKMGTLTVAGTLELTGSAPIIDCSTLTTTGGTIIYSLAGAQTLMVKGTVVGSADLNTYNNLVLRNTSAKTLSSNTTINGKLTLQNTASLALSTFTLSYGANATLEYAKSAAVTVDVEWPASSGPANVTINQASNVGFSTTVNTLRTITGTFTLSGGANFTVDDNAPATPLVPNVLTFANGSTIVRTAGLFNNSGGTYAIGTSSTDVVNLTINGNGLTSSGEFVSGQLNPGRFGTFTITAGNTYTLTSSAKFVNNLVLNGNLADGGATLTVRGNITGTGTHTGAGKIAMSGNTTSSNISGASFTNLELNDADGFALTGSASVSGTLTLTAGVLSTSSNTIIMNSPFTSVVSRSAGWVNGNLKKIISSDNAPFASFEVGDASNYAPVTIQFNFAFAGNTGSIIVSTTAGDHPQLSTSGLITTKSVNRFWTLTNDNAIAGLTSFTPTFNFVSGDIDAGATTSSFIIKRYASSAWSSTTAGTANALNTSASGLTGFGDFAIGEAIVPVITTSGTLLAFTAVAGTPSVAQSFSVSGADMNAGITLTPPSGFEVSTTSDFTANVGTNASPIVVGAAGTISSTTIYVRIQASAPEGSYNGLSVSLSSSGAVTKTVSIPNSSVTTAAVPTLVSSTASLTAFNATAVGSVSNELSFIVSGTNLTNDITVTAPTNFRVSTTSGSGFTTSVTLTQSGGTVANTTIYAQYVPTGSGSNSGDIAIASSGATSLTVAVSGSINTYYYQSGSPSVITNWTALANGTGSNPADFSSANIIYKILNNATTDAPWTISGSGSKIVLGDAASAGVTLTIASGAGITGTIDATAASSGVNSIVVAHTALPTFGTLHASSEVHLQASFTLSTAPSFAKLFVDGSSNTLQLGTGAQPKVATSLTVAAGCTLYSQGTSSIFMLIQSGATATINGTFRSNKPAGFVSFNEGASGNATTGAALQFAVAESAGMLTLGAASTISFTRDNSPTAQVINARTDYKNVNIDGVTNNKTFNGPSTISGTLTINTTTGPSTVTLAGAVTVQTSLVLGDTVLTASNLTLGNGASVSRSIGRLDAAPTFGTSVNLTYTGTTAVVVGNEMPSSTSVLNNLTVNNSGGVILDANATVNGTLTLTSGLFYVGSTALRTLTLNGPTIAGNGTNLQTTSTYTNLTFGGTASSLSIPSSVAALNNLTINNASATVTIGTSLTVAGTLALTSGTLLVGANTLTMDGLFTVGSGTLTTTASSSLAFGGSLAGPTITIPSNITALNNLTINNTYSPPATFNLGASISLAGNLTITSGTLAGGANVLTVAGNLAGTGTYTSTGNGRISMTGSSRTVSALTLGNLTVLTGSVTSIGATITGTLTMTQNVTVGAGNTLTINNKLLMNGSGSTTLSASTGTVAYGAGATLEYAKTSSTTVGDEWPAVNGPTNVTITTSSVGFSTTVSTNRTIPAGGNITLNGAAFTVNAVSGTPNVLTLASGASMTKLTNNGFNSSGGTYSFAGAVTINIGAPGSGLSAGSVVIGSSSEMQSSPGSALITLNIYDGYSLFISSTSTGTINRTVDNLNLNSTGIFTDNTEVGPRTLTVRGNITGTGQSVANNAASRIIMSGNTAVSTISAASLANLELNDADGFSLSGSPTITGTLTLTTGALAVGANTLTLNGPSTAGSGTLTTTTSSNLIFGGTNAGPVTMPGGVSNLNNLTINNTNASPATINQNSSITIAGSLSLTSGSLAVGSNTLTLNGTAIAGSGSLITTSASSLAYGGSGAGPFSIPSNVTALNNLTLNNTNAVPATLTVNSALSLAGNITITSGTLAGGTNVLTVAGNLAGTGTYTSSGAGKISMTGTARSVSALTLGNIEIAAGATMSNFGPTITGTFTMTGGNVTINSGNSLVMANNSSLVRVSGNLSLSGGSFAVGTSSNDVMNLTIDGNLTSTSEFPGGSANPGRIAMLTVNAGDTYTLTSSNKGVNNLTLNGTIVNDVSVLTVRGNISGTGTQTTALGGTGKILMNGNTTSSSISAATFTNLELNDADGFSTTASPTITGTLTLTAGVLTTTTNPVVATGLVNRTAGWVNGYLRRTVSSGTSSVTFDIGSATAYAPVALNFGSGTGGGQLTANTSTLSSPPANGLAPSGSGISQDKYIARYWTLGNSTLSTPSFAAAFSYSTSPSDIVGGANTGALIAALNNSGSWSNPGVASSVSPTVTTVSGLTGFGDFYLGESGCTNVGLTSATATSASVCSSGTTTLTYSGLTGTGTSVTWYGGSGGTGTTYGTGTPSSAVGPGTYYAYATGDCGSPVEIQVVVGSKTNVGLTSASANNSPICLSATTNLTYSGLSGTNASVTWFGGSGGTGTSYGTGTPSGDVGPGTYYAYATGDCGSPVQIQVVVGATTVNTFSGSGNWTDVSKWGCEVVPSAGDNFALGASSNAILNTNLNVSGTFTLDVTSTLTINPTRELAVASGGTVNFNGAAVTLKSDASGTAAIGKIIGTLSGATNVTIERYIPVYNSSFSPSHIKAWRLLSVPTYVPGGRTVRSTWQEGGNNGNGFGTQITGIPANALALGFDARTTLTSMQSYNGSAWVNLPNTNSYYIDTTGAYFVFIRGNRTVNASTAVTDNSKDATLRTTGSIYQGNGVSGAALPTSFSVAGNIYPSAIDFVQLQSNNSSKINGVYYLWDARRRNGTSLGSYQTFSATNSYGCTPGGGSFTLNQVNTAIQSGQGFFVVPKNPGTGDKLVFDENVKVSGSSNNAFRPVVPANRLVKIDTRLLDAENGEVADGNTVVFSSIYANAVDGDDAKKMMNSGENFGIQKGNARLAVEGRKPAVAGDEILFAAGNLKEKTYLLDVAAQNLDAENLTATLEDRYTQSSTLLDLNGSTRVPVAVDGNAASKAADRFRIVFGKPVLTGKAGFAVAPNPVEGSTINVRFMNQSAGRYTARLLGVDGKVLQTAVFEHAGGTATQMLQLATKFAAGMYQLELTGADKVGRVIAVLLQ